MTTYVVCAVRDAAMQAYMQPFFAPKEGAAIRSFVDEVKRAESPMHAHPEDYELFVLGEYNDEDASFTCGVPRGVLSATRAKEM